MATGETPISFEGPDEQRPDGGGDSAQDRTEQALRAMAADAEGSGRGTVPEPLPATSTLADRPDGAGPRNPKSDTGPVQAAEEQDGGTRPEVYTVPPQAVVVLSRVAAKAILDESGGAVVADADLPDTQQRPESPEARQDNASGDDSDADARNPAATPVEVERQDDGDGSEQDAAARVSRLGTITQALGAWTGRNGLDPGAWVAVEAAPASPEAGNLSDPAGPTHVGSALRVVYGADGALVGIEQRRLMQGPAGNSVEVAHLTVGGDGVSMGAPSDGLSAPQSEAADTGSVDGILAQMETALGLDIHSRTLVMGEVVPVEGDAEERTPVLRPLPVAESAASEPEPMPEMSAGAPLTDDELADHGIPAVHAGKTIQEILAPKEVLSAIWAGFSNMLGVTVASVGNQIAESVKILDTGMSHLELVKVGGGPDADPSLAPTLNAYYLCTSRYDDDGSIIPGTGRMGPGARNRHPVRLWQAVPTQHRMAQLAIARVQRSIEGGDSHGTGVADLARLARAYHFAHVAYRNPHVAAARARERRSLMHNFMMTAAHMSPEERRDTLTRIHALGATRRQLRPLARRYATPMPEARRQRAVRAVRQAHAAQQRRRAA